MKKFLIRTVFFLTLVLTATFIVLLQADGFTDPFYIRFTTPKQSSLILGTSRAAQSLQPDILDSILKRNDFFNYSFTVGHSPYGPTYLSSIKKKINPDTRDGLFIVTVDPWSISSRVEDPENPEKFEELNGCVAKTQYVNMNPNYDYLLHSYDEPFYKLLCKQQKEVFLHKNGWLEVSVDMDSATVHKRIQEKLNVYRLEKLHKYTFSSVRFKYFSATIDFLKQYGKVYVVRLPVHPEMYTMDSVTVPDFDKKIMALLADKKLPYLNMADKNNDFQYTDGNHLYKESGKKVTEIIAGWILSQISIASK